MGGRSYTPKRLDLEKAQEQWERFLPDLSHFENRVTIPPNAVCGTSGVIDKEDIKGKWAISADGLASAHWIVNEPSSIRSKGVHESECGGFTDLEIDGAMWRRFYGAKGTGFEWFKKQKSMSSEESYGAPARQRCIATRSLAKKEKRIPVDGLPIKTRGKTYYPLELDFPVDDFSKPTLVLPTDGRTGEIQFNDRSRGRKTGWWRRYGSGTTGKWVDVDTQKRGGWFDLDEDDGTGKPVQVTQCFTTRPGGTFSIFTQSVRGTDVPNGYWGVLRSERGGL
jgi:hypothetical protein